MKLTVLLCFICFMQVSAVTHAQKITLNKTGATLTETLNDIRRQSGYNILSDADVLATAKPVTVNVKGVSIEKALTECFNNQPLQYAIKGKYIIITAAQAAPGSLKPRPAAITISGTVTDEKGLPVPGVTVKVKGNGQATTTTVDGAYKIAVPDERAILTFSSIGYITLEVPVGGKAVVNVVLKEQNTGLNEVVVLGYGSARRKDVTGSVGQVSMEDFAKAPVKSFDDALAGRVAGVQVSSTDGQPGDVSNIVIRGAGSITQDNSPLYVIDGFPLENGNANSISPEDIESIDILKDASATAIYGARGANGVIVITTKKGKKGDPVINYNGYYGTQNNIKQVELMNPYEFVKYQLELNNTTATTRYLSGGRTLESYRDVPAIDFQDQVFRNAPMQNHNFSVRGGSDRTLFSISGNVINQDGIIVNSGFKRYQGRMSIDQTINNQVKVGINANYSNSRYYGTIPKSDVSTNASNSFLYSVWGYRPVTSTPGIDLGDDFIDTDINGSSDYRVNPYISAQNELRRSINNTLIANAYLEYRIIPSLTLRVTGGVTSNAVRDETFYNSMTSRGNFRNILGVNGSIYNSPVTNLLNENTLNWKKTFNKSHTLDVLAGYTMQFNTSSTSGFSAFNVPNESLGLDGLDQSLSQETLSSSSRWRLQSYLGRINYGYKSKYLLTASIRADGSSKFRPGKRWGYFPSGSVAWRINEEPFLKNIRAISNAKLRISYGQTGNNRVSDFPYLSQLTLPVSASYSYNNSPPALGAILSAFGNPDLKWETTVQTDIGFDFGLFNQRIDLTLDVYRKTTRDLLLNAQLPYTTGLSNAFKNIGEMQNQGLEISLNTINVAGANFRWSTNFNIAFNANKVMALTENQTVLTSAVAFDNRWRALPPYIAVLGQPVSQMYGVIWDGVYGYEDFNKTAAGTYVLKANVPNNGNPSANIQPGDIKYRDINGDGTINSSDFTIIGRGTPVHTGGLSNNFSYRQFDLNVFLQWSYGNDIVNANRLLFDGNGKAFPELNQYASYENRWSPQNQETNVYRTNGEGPAFYSSRIVEDGSFLRLKTVSFGYNLGKGLTRRLKLKNARAYVSAQNLVTLTNYSGPDPEVSTRNSTLTPGFDYSAYPRARTIILGLNVSL